MIFFRKKIFAVQAFWQHLTRWSMAIFCHAIFCNLMFSLFMFDQTILSHSLWANEEFHFEIHPGDVINIFAQKKNIYEKDGQKIVEGMGNLVILHGDQTLYGDRAKINFTQGQFEMNDNIRLVGNNMTLYGSKINYDMNTRNYTIENSKMFSAKYSIIAKKIVKLNDKDYIGEQAEFSTCLDCPESWSVYADHIWLTRDEYVQAKNAYIKIKGTDFMYLPYIIFPIKKERQSGLLFPKMSIKSKEGLIYEQPFFWNISPYQDMTLEPSYWMKRGLGLDSEYRWNFNRTSWITMHGFLMNDKIYLPNKRNDDLSNDHYMRMFQDVDVGWNPSPNWRHHYYGSYMRDLAMPVDFSRKLERRLIGPETGHEWLTQWQNKNHEVNVEGVLENSYLRSKEQVQEDLFSVDPHAVQLLPRFTYGSQDYVFNFSQSSFLPYLATQSTFIYSRFKQNNILENQFLRNVDRVELKPMVLLPWWRGEIFQLQTQMQLNAMAYNFSKEQGDVFSRQSIHMTTKWSFELEKIYGVAYWGNQSSEPDQVVPLATPVPQDVVAESKEVMHPTIGEVPAWKKSDDAEKSKVAISSYRHRQEVALLHHYLLREDAYGNKKFRSQIENTNGWFDKSDAMEGIDYNANQTEEDLKKIPQINTLEFLWHHDLIRKSPGNVNFDQDYSYIPDQFTFTNVAFLEFSQGLQLNKYHEINPMTHEETTLKEALSRLQTSFGWYFTPLMQLTFEDSYYHSDAKHITNVGMTNTWQDFTLANSLKYNGRAQGKKSHVISTKWSMNDGLQLFASNERDLDQNVNLSQTYGANIISSGGCWYMQVGYTQKLNDKQISFDFAVNFGGQTIGMNQL